MCFDDGCSLRATLLDELMAEPALAGAGLGEHLVDARPVDPPLVEQLRCRAEDLLPGLLKPCRPPKFRKKRIIPDILEFAGHE